MRTKKLPANALVPIISDGAIATQQWGDGRLIPVLVIDCNNRSDVRDLIYAHEYLPPGDVKITWGHEQFQFNTVFLILEFERPSNLSVLLKFDIARQGILVDSILHSRGVYLQPNDSGSRVIEGLERGKILVEVPDTGFLPTWESLFRKRITKELRKKGLSRRDAKEGTEQYINRIRELWQLRIGNKRSSTQ